jgi:hypothetical protein
MSLVERAKENEREQKEQKQRNDRFRQSWLTDIKPSEKLLDKATALIMIVIGLLILWIVMALFCLMAKNTVILYNILNVIRFIAKWGFILGLIVWLAIEAVGYVQHFRELIKK